MSKKKLLRGRLKAAQSSEALDAMADEHPLSVSPEDLDTSVDPIGSISMDGEVPNGHAGDVNTQLLLARQRLSELEFSHSGLQKDYQALLDAKAKKDSELAALLDDNENLMNTISTINVDNKERLLALRSENDQLKAKMKEIESRANGGITEVKKSDSLFGSLFGSKPASSSGSEHPDVKKYQDEAIKLKTGADALKAEHAAKLKALQDEKDAVQKKLEASEKSHAEKDSTMATMVNTQASIANKLADAEAELLTTKSQMEAFKIELSSRPASSQQDIDAAVASIKAEKEAADLELETMKQRFADLRVEVDQEQESQRRASTDTYNLLEKQLNEAKATIDSLSSEKATLQTKLSEQRDSLLAEMAAASDKDNSAFASLRKQLDEAVAATEEIQSKSAQEIMRLQAATQVKLEQLEQERQTMADSHAKALEEVKSAAASEKALSDAALTKFTYELGEVTLKLQELEEAREKERQIWAQEKETYQQAQTALEAEKVSLETEAKQRWESANASLLEAEQQKSHLTEQLDKVSKEKAAKAKKAKSLQTIFNKAEEANKLLQDELQSLKSQISQHLEQIGKLEAEIASQSAANASISQDRDAILARLTDIKRQSDETSEALIAAEAERDELRKYQDLYENETVAHATAQSMVDSLKAQVMSLEEAAHASVTRQAEKQIEWDTTKSKLEEDLSVLRQEVDNFRDEVPMLEMRHNSMKEQLERERGRLKELEIALGLEHDKCLQLTNSKEELTEKLASTTRQLSEDLEAHKADSSKTIESLQLRLAETQAALQTAQTELISATASIEYLTSKTSALEKETETLKLTLEEKSAELDTLTSESDTRIKELEQKVSDKEMEARIAEKQNLMTIQQLKAQIKVAETVPPAKGHQKTLSTGMAPSSSAGSVPRTKLAASHNAVTPVKRDSLSHSTSASSQYTPNRTSSDADKSSHPTSSHETIPTDIEALSLRIGELTKQNFTLHEQLKVSEESRRKTEKESRLKSQWIRQNSVKLKSDTPSTPTAAGTSTPGATQMGTPVKKSSATPQQTGKEGTPKRVAPPQENGFFSSLFGSTSTPTRSTPSEDVIQKRQALGEVLEETLLQKMQLEEEIKLVSSDLDTLQRQNRLLMETLVSNSIEVPILNDTRAPTREEV